MLRLRHWRWRYWSWSLHSKWPC